MRKFTAFAAAGAVAASLGAANADDGAQVAVTAAKTHDWGAYQVDDRRSGFTYAAKETRRIQEDDFQNPGFIWVEDGEALWEQKEGKAGKACASCHEDAETAMRGVGNSYPKFKKELGKLQNLEQKINECREKNMQAKPWKWESPQLLAMTTFVRHQSRDMPVSVKIDGEAAPFFKKGEEFYNQRRGQLDMACSHCHVDNPGTLIRANTLSEGQTNGFPTYRLKWQKIGSIHRRFRGCNKQVRATPFPAGSDEYVNLELYVAWRGRGLPVETPAVRN